MEPSPCTLPHQKLCKDTKNKHSSLVDLIITKQNKLPSFIDRWAKYEHGYAQKIQSQLERRLWRNQNAFICVLRKEYQYNES
jgi:hypothetical protein